MQEAEFDSLIKLLPDNAIDLLSATGLQTIENIGLDVIQNVIHDVLCGKNIRDSTETITRKRITHLNLALLQLIMNGIEEDPKFVERLPTIAAKILLNKGNSKEEKWVCYWILGLTNKAFQNVLRDDHQEIDDYTNRYLEINYDAIEEVQEIYGELEGQIQIGNQNADVDWLFFSLLLNTIGSETLTIRGSEKSAYGKLFEKLILGALLHILGFNYQSERDLNTLKKVFWLSTQGEKRESDATLFFEAGKGVRFDIGFIGRGNPEISLDKVTRFQREITLGRSKWYMATIIIVDRISKNSSIVELAENVNGHIIQMSMGYWIKNVVQILNDTIGFEHPISNMKDHEISDYLTDKIENVPIKKLLDIQD